MKAARKNIFTLLSIMLICFVIAGSAANAYAQKQESEAKRSVQTVTIPVTVRLDSSPAQKELQFIDFLQVLENGVPQEILAKRGGSNVPLTLAILIQDDVVQSIANEIEELAKFIRRMPPNSRVLVGYLTAGSVQVRQRFTTDLDRAARALRIPLGSPSSAPYNPFVQTLEALKRFEGQPTGSRRAVLLISDGLDSSRGIDSASPKQSHDLQRAINDAQRRGVAVYSIYAPTTGGTANGNSLLVSYGQSSLQRLSSETGGHAFFQGTREPVSFDPFLRELNTLLSRQFALTYLSTNTEKGFRRIEVVSNLEGGEILHPSGYTRR